jgi:hypothetical protein
MIGAGFPSRSPGIDPYTEEFMKSLAALGLLLCLISLPARGEGAAVAARGELLDFPGGHPIALLLSGATALPTGESREGYVQVALVGWIRSPGTAPAAEPESIPSPPPAASAAAPYLSGVIAAPLPSGEVRYGSGARVAVLGPKEELDAAWSELKGSFEKESAALDLRIEEARLQEKNALASSENLTQASQNLDRAKTARKQAERDKQELRNRFASRADGLFRSHQVAESIADAEGRYSFEFLPPGSYRLLAVFTLGSEERRWYLPVETTSAGGVRKDLKGDDTGPDPFFGAR